MEFKQTAEHADYLTFTQTDAPEGLDPVKVEVPRALHNLTRKDGTLSMSVHLSEKSAKGVDPSKRTAPLVKPSVVGYTDNDRHAPRVVDNMRPAHATKDGTKPEPTAGIPYTDNLRENDPGAIDAVDQEGVWPEPVVAKAPKAAKK